MPNPFEQLRRQDLQVEIFRAKIEAEAADRKSRLLRGDMSALPSEKPQEINSDESELNIPTKSE